MIDGIKITEELLRSLGCEFREGGDPRWVLLSGNYLFWFSRGPVASTWVFGVGDEDVSRCRLVTHLSECFGVVADESYGAGMRDKRLQFRRLLDEDDVTVI